MENKQNKKRRNTRNTTNNTTSTKPILGGNQMREWIIFWKEIPIAKITDSDYANLEVIHPDCSIQRNIPKS